MEAPKRGQRFLHARQIKEVRGVPVREWPPEECEVTRVTRYAVYFRNSTGFKSVVDREKFPEAVKEWIS